MGNELRRREMVEAAGGTDSSIIYELSTPTSLTGSGYINTGIAAFGTDKDLTITVSATNSKTNGRARWYATNEGSVKVSFYVNNGTAARFDYFGGNYSFTLTNIDYTKPQKVVFTHTKNTGKAQGYFSYYNTSGVLVSVSSGDITATSSPQTLSQTVSIGGVSIAGTQAINGTVYNAVIRERVMSASEITDFLNS